MEMFFQLVTREDGKQFERWGCVSHVTQPAREAVIEKISLEHARGEWLEWQVEVTVRGAAVTNFYSAFESELVNGVEKERESGRAPRRRSEGKVGKGRALVQLKMEVPE